MNRIQVEKQVNMLLVVKLNVRFVELIFVEGIVFTLKLIPIIIFIGLVLKNVNILMFVLIQ